MKYYPKHLQIETVNKYCNARCPMCTIFDSPREPRIMSLEEFRFILKRFLPYKEHIKFLTLHGCGEPLIDKTMPEKVAFAKEMGFKGIGFSSNCEGLKAGLSERLLRSGLDTLIASIDGATEEVQEAIRLGTNFDKVYSNTIKFINIRDKRNYQTRVLIRFIRQKLNYDQWDEYYEFWSQFISPEKGDDIIQFDIHNCADKIDGYNEMLANGQKYKDEGYMICPDLFERFIVFASGLVGFCSADQGSYFDFGNVLDNDPITIFNNQTYKKYRKAHLEKRQNELEYCRTCTISNSRHFKQKPRTLNVSGGSI